MDIETDDWVPPGEAELKVIQARRERSDKISKVMGSYLLKGYKMLGDVCEVCGTILLQKKGGSFYCVGCSEVDNEFSKDDPASSDEAARRQVEESLVSHRSTGKPTKVQRSAVQYPMSLSNALAESVRHETSDAVFAAETPTWVLHSTEVLKMKLVWASERLSSEQSVDNSIKLCSLIKACADALTAIANVENAVHS